MLPESLGLRRRAREHRFTARLAFDYAQVPAVWSLCEGRLTSERVCGTRFDAIGELLASCSTGGTIVVQQTLQFASSAIVAESTHETLAPRLFRS